MVRTTEFEAWCAPCSEITEAHHNLGGQGETMRFGMFVVLIGFVACGGSSSSGPTEAPIMMTAAGLSTKAVTIPSGGRVTFFNMDTVALPITSPDFDPDLDT